MLIGTILAVVLAFMLAGAVSYLPLTPQVTSKNQPSPQPTNPPLPMPSTEYSGSQTFYPLPSTSSIPPTAVPASATTSIEAYPILFAVAAIIVGIVAVRVLFSEKELKQNHK